MIYWDHIDQEAVRLFKVDHFDAMMDELRDAATEEVQHIFASVIDALGHSAINRSRERTTARNPCLRPSDGHGV